MVSCFSQCFLDKVQKKRLLDVVEETYENYWGYCIDKKVYNAIKDGLNIYEKTCLIDIPPNEPNRHVVIKWMQHHLYDYPENIHQPAFETSINYHYFFERWIDKLKRDLDRRRDGQDIEMRLLMFKAGYVKISTKVNRAKYIGKEGAHHTQKHWKTQNFARIKLTTFPEDRERMKFAPIYDLPDRLKILLVIKDFSANIRNNIINQLKGLLSERHHVTILTSKAIGQSLEYKVVRYDLSKQICFDLPNNKQNDYDVIYLILGDNENELVDLEKLRGIKAKLVVSMPLKNKLTPQLAKLFKYSDLILTSCKFFKDRLIQLGCKAKKIKVLHSPIRCYNYLFSVKSFKQGSKINIVSFSQFKKESNIKYAVATVASLLRKYSNIRYLILGDGPERANVTKFIKELNLDEKIKIINLKKRDDIIEVLRKSHICLFVQPFKYNNSRKSIPKLLKTVMAHGLIVISVNHSGISELIEDTISGFLISEKNMLQIRKKIRYLIEHDDKWKNISRAARKRIEKLFDTRVINMRLVQLMQKLIK